MNIYKQKKASNVFVYEIIFNVIMVLKESGIEEIINVVNLLLFGLFA